MKEDLKEMKKGAVKTLKEIKEKAVDEAKKTEVVDGKFSLRADAIFKYLEVFHPRMLKDEIDFDKKNRGYFLKTNIIATGGGYFLLEHFWYAQWKTYKHSTKRKNLYLCGWNEKGYFFSHPIKYFRLTKDIKDNWWERALEFIWNGKLKKLAYRQGEIGLVKVKKLPEKYEEFSEYRIGNHLIRVEGKIIRDGKLFIEGKGVILHLRKRHDPVYFQNAKYQVITTKDFDIWDFSKPVD